nr:hypothetical protein Itr_chr02CG15240 [Ipomoea trifida]
MKRNQKPFSWQSETSGTRTLSQHLHYCHNMRNDEGQLEREQMQISGYATTGRDEDLKLSIGGNNFKFNL